MPTVTLYYFDARGRAEIIRLLLAAAGIPYTDKRLTAEEFAALKPTLPTGQVPVIQVDDKMYPQSFAIARHIAVKHNIAGKDEHERFLCDIIVDTVADLWEKFGKFGFFMPDGDEKTALTKKFTEEELPKTICSLDKMAGDHPGCFVGDKLTWADIVFFDAFSVFRERELHKHFEASPEREKIKKVKAIYDAVEKNAKIAEWLAKRPKTKF